MKNLTKIVLTLFIIVEVNSPQLFAEPTFNKDVAPIIFKNCTACHRPGEAAPFSMQTFADVQKRGEMIAHVISERLMPPWKAEQSDYSFRYERRLSEDQVSLINTWIKAGMPEGDSDDLPSLPKFTPGWSLGEPDMVVTMTEAFRVPAEGPDIYRNFVIPLNLKTDRWVKAIDFRPSARSVVHHSLFFFESNGLARMLDNEDSQPGFKGGMGAMMRLRGGPPVLSEHRAGQAANSGPQTEADKHSEGGRLRINQGLDNPTFGGLGGWALGALPHLLPDGLAFRLPAGSDLILATHFHSSGKEEFEQSTVGLYFADAPTTRRFTPIQLPPAFGAFKNIDIPAGSRDYTIEDSFELPVDVEAFGVGAHAHYLGKSMRLTATLPTGEVRTLLSITDWDFAWQEQYRFAEYVFLPKGTKLISRVSYDNSTDNPRNPSNPPARVQFGEESTNEMASITLTVVAAQESEMPTLQEAYRNHFRAALARAPIFKMLQDQFRSK